MNFYTAIKTCFNKYAVFSGRASRSEFWFFKLGIFIGGLAFGIINVALFVLWSLVIILPVLAVTVRRIHDRGRSGWLLLYYNIIQIIFIGSFISSFGKDSVSVPVAVGSIVLIVVGVFGFAIPFLSLPGTKGPNQYGDEPLVSASQDAGQVNYPAQKTHGQNRTGTDNLALLERLHELRQKAILTDAEFEQQKKRILAG